MRSWQSWQGIQTTEAVELGQRVTYTRAQIIYMALCVRGGIPEVVVVWPVATK